MCAHLLMCVVGMSFVVFVLVSDPVDPAAVVGTVADGHGVGVEPSDVEESSDDGEASQARKRTRTS